MLSLSGTFRATISSASSKAGIPSSSSATRNAWRRERKNKIEGSYPRQAAELLLIRSKKVHCKQPHSDNNSAGEQLHQFNSCILGTNRAMASSHCLEKPRQGAKNLAWQAGQSSLHTNSPGLPLLWLQPVCVSAQLQRGRPGRRGCVSPAWQTPFQAPAQPGASPVNRGLRGAHRQLPALRALQMVKLPASSCLLLSS